MFWSKTLSCRECCLPKGFIPQIRPVGLDYDRGNIVFMQINPGQIGRLTEKQIKERYKTERNRVIARLKHKTSNHLMDLQKQFLSKPNNLTWKILCEAYGKACSDVWGWLPGSYGKTIEKHGVNLNEIAVVNIAQCPVPDDNYGNHFLLKCWSKRTKRLLEILEPRIIVAQGKTVLRFLNKYLNTDDYIIVEGVHHSSRMSNAEKQSLFSQTQKVIMANLR